MWQARLLALSDVAWDTLLQQQQDAYQSARLYRARFPPARAGTGQALLSMLLYFLAAAGLLALLGFCLQQAEAVRTGARGLHAANWAVALLGCCASLLYTAFGAVLGKRAAREDHNWERRQANTDALVGSLQTACSALLDARQALARDPRAMVDPALDALEAAVEAYDACNTIASGVPAMPFPALELLLYGCVALVFVGVAAYAYGWMDVGGRLGMARDLLVQRGRLRRGEPVDDLARLLECAAPPKASPLAGYVLALLLLLVNVAFLVAAGRGGDYAAALAAVQGCV